MAQLLIDGGAHVSAASEHGWTPLHAAASNGSEAVVRLLIHAGADVSAANEEGSTPPHLAAPTAHEAVA